jgi:hypothetical protein
LPIPKNKNVHPKIKETPPKGVAKAKPVRPVRDKRYKLPENKIHPTKKLKEENFRNLTGFSSFMMSPTTNKLSE